MPGGDRTGPMGAGPRTGGARGYCSGFDQPGYANPRGRGGFGSMRAGGGRGWRHRYFASGLPGRIAYTPEQETVDLQSQADWLKAQLDGIQKRLDELKTEKEK